MMNYWSEKNVKCFISAGCVEVRVTCSPATRVQLQSVCLGVMTIVRTHCHWAWFVTKYVIVIWLWPLKIYLKYFSTETVPHTKKYCNLQSCTLMDSQDPRPHEQKTQPGSYTSYKISIHLKCNIYQLVPTAFRLRLVSINIFFINY